MVKINYGSQFLDKKDFRAVNKTLKSKFLTQGPLVEKFENKLKKKFKAKHCTVVSSGTAALHLLGQALGWKENDIILTTPLSFVATSNCILYANAKPIFVDIDLNTGNICTSKLKEKIINLKKKKKLIKAIIAMDYGGIPCEWEKLKLISTKYNIILINDGCHSMGSSINNDISYALKFADYVTYSFHPVKSITTGEGGAILSKDSKLDFKLKTLRTHGIKRNNIWSYDMINLGYNYRITDIQCSLGISQLSKLEKFISKRNKIAKIYNNEFEKINNIELLKINKNFKSSYHLFPIKINFKNLQITKNEFLKKMLKFGIKIQVHYIPIYHHTYYKKNFKYLKTDFPNCERFYDQIVSLPIYFNLSNRSQKYIIKSIKKIILQN